MLHATSGLCSNHIPWPCSTNQTPGPPSMVHIMKQRDAMNLPWKCNASPSSASKGRTQRVAGRGHGPFQREAEHQRRTPGAPHTPKPRYQAGVELLPRVGLPCEPPVCTTPCSSGGRRRRRTSAPAQCCSLGQGRHTGGISNQSFVLLVPSDAGLLLNKVLVCTWAEHHPDTSWSRRNSIIL